MPEYSIECFDKSHQSRYKDFVSKNFGKRSYQSSTEYIDWLYLENPFGAGYQDFRLILCNNEHVVGCMHKLRFQLADQKNGQVFTGIAAHNLMVSAEHRNGTGFLLINELLGKEKFFIVPGVVGRLSEMYRKIGGKSLTFFCGQKLHLPNFWSFLKRVKGADISKRDVYDVSNSLGQPSIKVSFECSDSLLKSISRLSPRVSLGEQYVRWRLFAKNEVRTIVLEDVATGSLLLMAVGKRKGIPVGRVFYTDFSDDTVADKLTTYAVSLSSGLGCLASLVISGDTGFSSVAEGLGIREKRAKPDAYIFSKDLSPDDLRIWPLLSDYGFEERFGRLA